GEAERAAEEQLGPLDDDPVRRLRQLLHRRAARVLDRQVGGVVDLRLLVLVVLVLQLGGVEAVDAALVVLLPRAGRRSGRGRLRVGLLAGRRLLLGPGGRLPGRRLLDALLRLLVVILVGKGDGEDGVAAR